MLLKLHINRTRFLIELCNNQKANIKYLLSHKVIKEKKINREYLLNILCKLNFL